MRSHRKTIPIAAVLTLALVALVPSAAGANPLLSGYGGPGQGDQAIIGAALVNGPGQGGSGSSGGGGGEASAGPVNLEAAPSTSTTPGSSSSAKARHTGRHHHSSSGVVPAQRSSTPSSATRDASLPPASTEASSGSGGTLGLSGSDLLYILLALGGLVVTAVATRQLASRPQPEGGQLKG
jgi:hypothetical protein